MTSTYGLAQVIEMIPHKDIEKKYTLSFNGRDL